MIDAARDIELDTGPRAPERERLCVATRTVRPVSELIRFVIGPDGEPVPDLKRKLPGRGIWVTANERRPWRGDQAQGVRPRLQARSSPAADLVDRTERLLERAVARCAGDRRQGRAGRRRLRQDGCGAGARGGRRPAACRRGRVRRGPQARRRSCAAGSPVQAPAVIRIFDLGAIGFGIGPVKCDTCSPARRPCERDLFGALPRAWSGFGPAMHEGRRGCAGLPARN